MLIILLIAVVEEENTYKFLYIWAKDSNMHLVELISIDLIMIGAKKSKEGDNW